MPQQCAVFTISVASLAILSQGAYHMYLLLNLSLINWIINLLLTEREGRTGEYWPEVVAVRSERSEVRTKTAEGQYFPVRSRASEVNK